MVLDLASSLAPAGASGARPHFNGWVGLAETAVAETLARAGFASLTLDAQHGQATFASMFDTIGMATQIGVPVLVRVPVGGLGLASRVLDAGAAGVIFPMVDTQDDARAFANVMKFPPLGRRSWAPHRALSLTGMTREDYLARANGLSFAFAMVETREALDNLDAILATPGVDGVFIGPNDLCVSLTGGAHVDPGNASVLDALDTVIAACERAGKTAGIFANNPDFARDYVRRGFPFVALGSDTGFLKAGAQAALAASRG